MYVHSAWLQTRASVARLNAVATRLGEPVGEQAFGGGLSIRAREFADQRANEWESSTTTGAWRVGLAVLPGLDPSAPEDRLVGLVATAPALLAGLVAAVQEALYNEGDAAERVQFPLRPLLTAAARDTGVVPRSIRLRSERLRTLIQSDDEQALREQAAAAEGEVVGLTIEAGRQRVTVLDNGSVVFDESTSLADVVVAIKSIQLALQASAPVPAE